MKAVIQTGGKQVSVAEGDVLHVELLPAEPGQATRFDDVRLLIDGETVKIGRPTVPGASVDGEVLAEVKGPKTRAVKFRRRADSMTVKGHRQRYHKVKIKQINAG